jgi:hypothetical protein
MSDTELSYCKIAYTRYDVPLKMFYIKFIIVDLRISCGKEHLFGTHGSVVG